MIDPAQLSEWFEAYCAPLTLYARQWLDRAAAEDVVQEVYVRLMSQPVTPANVKAWLFKAVRNEAISQSRSTLRRRKREQNLPGAREEWFETSASDLIDGAAARKAMESLPPPQREVIVLRIWGQMTLKEAAAVTGSSISTVFDQYRAGLKTLRERMSAPCKTKKE
ncbi:MAG: polymerase sigma factor, sigma-70 family [Phycisphaerales bacterium]|nr:polymerase sigma factor, sigma-70 family [Phycisphaerales bacterium]